MTHKDYWMARLQEERQPCRFPFVHDEALMPSGSVASGAYELDGPLAAKLATVCKDDRSLYVVLVTAVFTLLRFVLEEDRLCVTTCIERELEAADGLSFLLPLIADFRQAACFRDLLHVTRTVYAEAQAHAAYPIQYLWNNRERQSGRSCTTAEIAVTCKNIHQQHIPSPGNGPELAMQFYRASGAITCTITYDASLYHSGDIDRIFNHYQQVLHNGLTRPDASWSTLDWLAPGDRWLWAAINETSTDYPAGSSVVEVFEEIVSRFPAKVALVNHGVQVTYQQLNTLADALAERLMGYGVGINTPVAVLLPGAVDYIVTILAILKAGGVYVPLSVTDPVGRIQELLNDVCPALLITARNVLHAYNLPPEQLESVVVYLEDQEEVIIPNKRETRTFDLAYILFTSGSTGKPKGALISHRNILRLVCGTRYLDFSPDMRMLLTGALTFDATTFEIWGCLLNGGTLQLVNNDSLLNVERLAAELEREQINTLWLTTPFFHLLARHTSLNVFAPLRQLIVGGDVVSPKLVQYVRENNPGLTIINGYGPTENTTFSLTHTIKKEYITAIPIGRPISNDVAYVLGMDGRLRPIGSWGRLYVGGDGLFRGYLNNPVLTQQRLAPDPFAKTPGKWLYDTGDIARLLPDGTIAFKGRADNQVKIRGYRIALGEIEQQLLAVEGIQEAIVLAREAGDEKRLVAYYTGRPTGGPQAIRTALAARLPEYMVPVHYCHLDTFQLTGNGKIDRHALPEVPVNSVTGYEQPVNEMEGQLAEIWCSLLQLNKEQVGRHTHFFEAGGHSLKASVLINRIRQTFNADLTIKDIFSAPTLSQLAVCIQQKATIEVII